MNGLDPPQRPAHGSAAWYRNELRIWWAESPANERIVYFITIILVGGSIFGFSFKFLFGTLNYCLAYFRAALWDDVVQDSCAAIKQELKPFWDLSFSDYSRWNRCFGNEAGFERQGQLFLIAQDLLFHMLGPFGRSPILILVFAISVWFLGPWFGRQLGNVIIYVFTTPFTLSLLVVMVPTVFYRLAYTLWFYAALSAIIIALVVLFAIQFFTVNDVLQGMNAGGHNPSFGSVSSLYAYLVATLVAAWHRMYDIPWAQQRVCTHAPLCQCRDELDRQAAQYIHDKQELSQSILYYRDLLTESVFREKDLRTQNTKFQVERDSYKYMAELPRTTNSTRSYPWGLPPPQPDLSGALDEARSKIGQLLAEADDIKAANRKELAAWKAQVAILQTQVNYSQGAGQDRSLTQDQLKGTKARVRALERELKDMTFTSSMLRQELAKEKEHRSEKCQKEAICQREILALQVACDKYRHYQTENDLLARDAAKRWKGLDDTAVAHLTIRSYLEETTLTLMRLQALGTPGLNTTDLQVEMIRRDGVEDAKYKNRLERELERLGGNVIDIRVGLESTRPQDWKTETLTYEQNRYRVFPIYGRIVQAVIELSGLLQAVAPDQLPLWKPEPGRNDFTTQEDGKPLGSFQVVQLLSRSNQFINPTAPHESGLIEKLTVAECQRWYNRGVQLQAILIGLCNNVEFVRKRPLEELTHLTKVIVPQTEFILKQTLHDVLIDVCLLKRDDTEKQATSREKKRFEVYTAMQHAITAMTKCILTNQRKPPIWGPAIQNSITPITRSDDLATHLVIHEIINLENRILQLRQFMNDFQMPGTRFGPVQSEIQGDNGRYKQMWNEAVASQSWAELTLMHWTVWKAQKPIQQIGDDGIPVVNSKGEPVFKPRPETDPKMMPLKYDDFLLNIKMKNAEVKEKKDKWPEDHVPVAYFDPVLGPMIKFVPKSDLRNKEKNKDDKTKDKTEGTDGEKAKAREEFNTNAQRMIQLSNHIREWGIKGDTALPSTNQLAKNAALATIRKAIEEQKQQLGMLHGVMKKDKREAPKWPKNGGPMHTK